MFAMRPLMAIESPVIMFVGVAVTLLRASSLTMVGVIGITSVLVADWSCCPEPLVAVINMVLFRIAGGINCGDHVMYTEALTANSVSFTVYVICWLLGSVAFAW